MVWPVPAGRLQSLRQPASQTVIQRARAAYLGAHTQGAGSATQSRCPWPPLVGGRYHPASLPEPLLPRVLVESKGHGCLLSHKACPDQQPELTLKLTPRR